VSDASSVSSLVTRFHRQGLDHTAGFQALYSQFATLTPSGFLGKEEMGKKKEETTQSGVAKV